MLKDSFKLAVKNLRKRGVRSWLTMLGIFISVATIFTLISLSLGLQGAVTQQFETLGTDKFFIFPDTLMMGGPGVVGFNPLTEKDVDAISKVSGIKDYSYVTMANAKVEHGNEDAYVLVAGYPLDHVDVLIESGGYKTSEGKFPREGDSRVVSVGSLFAEENKIFEKPLKTGDRILINGKEFKVRGLTAPIGNPSDDSMILMSIDDFRETFNNTGERVDQVIIQVDEGQDVRDVAGRVEKKLRNYRGQTEKTQDFTISTPEDLLKSVQTILNILTYFLAGIAAISLIVGAVGIANTMYTSVIERTKEIGVMKAIGAKNSDILTIFLVEAGLLGSVGAAIGVILGYGMSKTIEIVVTQAYATNLLQAAAPWYLVVGCLVFGFLVGIISGGFPALQASKTNVVDALRYE